VVHSIHVTGEPPVSPALRDKQRRYVHYARVDAGPDAGRDGRKRRQRAHIRPPSDYGVVLRASGERVQFDHALAVAPLFVLRGIWMCVRVQGGAASIKVDTAHRVVLRMVRVEIARVLTAGAKRG
jgi:hypothetical protein